MKKNTTQAVTYRQLISKSAEQIQSEELDLKVQQAKSQLEVTIATSKRDLAQAKQQLEKAKSSLDYVVEAEITAAQKVEALEKGIAFATNILKTRFCD